MSDETTQATQAASAAPAAEKVQPTESAAAATPPNFGGGKIADGAMAAPPQTAEDATEAAAKKPLAVAATNKDAPAEVS